MVYKFFKIIAIIDCMLNYTIHGSAKYSFVFPLRKH